MEAEGEFHLARLVLPPAPTMDKLEEKKRISKGRKRREMAGSVRSPFYLVPVFPVPLLIYANCLFLLAFHSLSFNKDRGKKKKKLY